MLKIKNITLYLWIVLFASCNNHTPSTDKVDQKELEESLVNVNKKLVKSEEEQILDFINRYGWEMQETGTGLRYKIYRHGSGPIAEKNQWATIAYEVTLLNGEILYSSDTDGLKEFKIGQGGIESGLEEGILLMKKGDRAKFIIPSHLAFGLLGDSDKIPAKATLVYDIELVELK